MKRILSVLALLAAIFAIPTFATEAQAASLTFHCAASEGNPKENIRCKAAKIAAESRGHEAEISAIGHTRSESSDVVIDGPASDQVITVSHKLAGRLLDPANNVPAYELCPMQMRGIELAAGLRGTQVSQTVTQAYQESPAFAVMIGSDYELSDACPACDFHAVTTAANAQVKSALIGAGGNVLTGGLTALLWPEPGDTNVSNVVEGATNVIDVDAGNPGNPHPPTNPGGAPVDPGTPSPGGTPVDPGTPINVMDNGPTGPPSNGGGQPAEPGTGN